MALGSGLSGCLDASGEDESTGTDRDHRTTVSIRDGEFSPSSWEAAAGHEVTVVFENHDDRDHVLRGDFGDFEVRVPPGGTVSRAVTVPEKPGDYAIDCPETTGSFELEAVPADVLGGCSLDESNE
ncbi:Halocyanin [Halorhabdus sp. SVX81]|nr:Halocyanin [Halorhabdus sp. SVX81]